MTVLIPIKLKNMVERYLCASNRNLEMGGYFFGSNDTIKAFLPTPNAHQQPSAYHQEYSNATLFAECYSKMIGEPIIADMHTHPNGTVASEGDRKYIEAMRYKYHLLISDKGSSWDWFILNRQFQSVSFVHNEMEIEVYSEAICAEMGMDFLGQVFLTPMGEVVGKPEARKYLSVDQDAYRVEKWFLKERRWNWSFAQISREIGLSPDRVKKACVKLGRK